PIETIRPAPLPEAGAIDGTGTASGATVQRMVRRAGAGVRVRLPRIAMSAVLTLFAWPVGAPGISPGIDASWGAALHMASRDGLVFGRDVLFTYGPLGYLVDAHLYFTGTWVLAVAAHLAADLLLAYSLLRLLERGMGLLPAALVTAPVLVLLSRLLLVGSPLLPETVVLVVMLWSFEVVLDSQERVSAARVLLAATAAATVTMMKLDAGMACVLFAGFALTVEGSRRGARAAAIALGQFLAAAATALLLLWLLSSQPIGALPDWLNRSVDIVRGYGAAMNIENGQHWEYTAAFLLI